jgi:hypothetical protein
LYLEMARAGCRWLTSRRAVERFLTLQSNAMLAAVRGDPATKTTQAAAPATRTAHRRQVGIDQAQEALEAMRV